MQTSKFKAQNAGPALTFALFMFNFALCEPALAFKILSPTDGQTVSAGDTIPITIDVGRDTGLVQVRYYWYGEQDDTLVEQADTNSTGSIVATASMVSTAASDPPYGGRLLVPQDGI